MSDLIQAAASIRKVANLFKDFEVAATAIERVGSFEQAEAEAKAATAVAQEALVVAQGSLADVKEYSKQVMADIEHVRKNGEEADKLAITHAREAADRNTTDLLAATDLRIAERQAAADVKLDGIIAQTAIANDVLLALHAERDQIQTQTQDKEKELSTLQDQIESTKAALRKLVG